MSGIISAFYLFHLFYYFSPSKNFFFLGFIKKLLLILFFYCLESYTVWSPVLVNHKIVTYIFGFQISIFIGIYLLHGQQEPEALDISTLSPLTAPPLGALIAQLVNFLPAMQLTQLGISVLENSKK